MAQDNKDDEIDQHLRCPITLEIFHTPVLLESEHTIEKAIADNARDTTGLNPMNGEPLGEYILNRRMQARVAQHLKEHPEQISEQYGYQAPAEQAPAVEAKEVPSDDLPMPPPSELLQYIHIAGQRDRDRDRDDAEHDTYASYGNGVRGKLLHLLPGVEQKHERQQHEGLGFFGALPAIAAPPLIEEPRLPIKLPPVAAIVKNSHPRQLRQGLRYNVLCLGDSDAGKTIYINAAANGISKRGCVETIGLPLATRELPSGIFNFSDTARHSHLQYMSLSDYHGANLLLFFPTGDVKNFHQRIRHASDFLGELELISLDYKSQDDGSLIPVPKVFDQALLNAQIIAQSVPVIVFDAQQVQGMSDCLLTQLATRFDQILAPPDHVEPEAPKAAESRCVLQ